MRHLVEISGECEELAVAEALAACSAAGSAALVEKDGRALVIESAMPANELAARLGLAWSVSEHLFSCSKEELESCIGSLSLPEGSLRVRASRMDESHSPGSGTALAKQIGAILSRQHKVDLERPDMELRVLMSGRLHVGMLAGEIDRSGFESRKPDNRPYNHPISLHPKLARAMVNLTRVKPRETLLDPFCGTGGVLIEAGLVGCRTLGGDIDPRMVAGSRLNLAHFRIGDARIFEMDISGWPSEHGPVDAIATDPPYGRSASTAKEPIESLYRRAFASCLEVLKAGGRLAIALPKREHASLADGFELEGTYPVRVHKSLTRYFCVFRKP